MKSFCIKNNNEQILKYLLKALENAGMEGIYISKKSFKNYKNIIVHYKGDKEEDFIICLCGILTGCVIKFYEKNIIKKNICADYFYFDLIEKDYIYASCVEILNDKNEKEFENRNEKIFLSFYEYIKENKFFILDGFINFRLFEYRNLLSEVVDIAVNKFIIDKEYRQFIKLLQEYINSKASNIGLVHVIYSETEPIILDENENIIHYDRKLIQAKYLSDISFSSKDYCLNELLNLLPKKIILHLIGEEDEFINTLELIFKGRISICKDCNICKTFSVINNSLKIDG